MCFRCTQECNDPDRICPSQTCECTETPLFPMPLATTPAPPAAITTPEGTEPTKDRCVPNGTLGGDYWVTWCQQQCDRGYCAVDQCICYQN